MVAQRLWTVSSSPTITVAGGRTPDAAPAAGGCHVKLHSATDRGLVSVPRRCPSSSVNSGRPSSPRQVREPGRVVVDDLVAPQAIHLTGNRVDRDLERTQAGYRIDADEAVAVVRDEVCDDRRHGIAELRQRRAAGQMLQSGGDARRSRDHAVNRPVPPRARKERTARVAR